MRLVNLTGCRILISDEGGRVLDILSPSDQVAYLEGATDEIYSDGRVRVERLTPEDISGLPDPEEGILYIVNYDVARATDREDVVTPELSPDSAHLVADTFIGVRRFLSIRKSDTESSSVD